MGYVPVIDWTVVAPLGIVAVTGMIALIVHMLTGNSERQWTQKVTALGLLVAATVLLGAGGSDRSTFDQTLVLDRLGSIGQLLTVLAALIVTLVSPQYFSEKRIKLGEFYPLLAWATAGGMLVCGTRHLLNMFVGIEILSISLYVLAGLHRTSRKSEESAMKYFLLGAFATGFLLYGIAMFYGATGSLDSSTLVAYWSHGNPENRVLLAMSFALITVGLGFKCSLVPFHQWTPDVYEGAPTNVVAFMATGGKVAAFVALWNFADGFGTAGKFVATTFAALSVASMIVGNVLAMRQKNIKRLLAYSSIANAGYVAVTAASVAASYKLTHVTLLYFLVGYVLTSAGFFVVLLASAKNGSEAETIDDLRGLSGRSPVLAYSMVVFVLSLIGLGPVSGFLGKVLILRDAVSVNMTWLAVVMVLNSIFGAFYYFGILKAIFSPAEGDSRAISLSGAQIAALGLCVLGVVGSVVGFTPLMNHLGLR
ncbi:MAG: NADH-quinone oxidoreductase subunit N [Armatimonadota bacterium]